MQGLSSSEYAELRSAFADLINYEADDPMAPVEPLTYVAPDGDTCLHVASQRGNIRAVELLVKAGVDVNRQGDMGSTPLHCAATPEVAAFLVASGASVTIRDEFGRLPLQVDEGTNAP
ncbi:ankyrin repeat domain-containing protein [Paucibacter sp. B51]|uniref:ankyrin repeat domain-containing protein n=1 Tax=Paucibacter sp. B51 TaxID=2993315 RepID=UPI0022EBCEAB|nr:ankyrin repeat domain-containing protein [Paucibacter sp. B51]